MYIELLAFAIVVASGTYLYKTLAIPGVMLIIYCLLLIILYMSIHHNAGCLNDIYSYSFSVEGEVLRDNKESSTLRTKKYTDIIKGPNMTGLGVIWMIWLVYGYVLKEIDLDELDHEVAHVQSTILLCLVAGSYMKDVQEKPYVLAGLVLFYSLMICIPHSDTIAYLMSPAMLFTKILAFMVIYCSSSLILFTSKVNLGNSQKKFIQKHDEKGEEGNSAKITIDDEPNNSKLEGNTYHKRENTLIKDWTCVVIQSSWVLFSSRYTLIAIFFQIMVYMPSIMASYNSYRTLLNKTIDRIKNSKARKERELESLPKQATPAKQQAQQQQQQQTESSPVVHYNHSHAIVPAAVTYSHQQYQSAQAQSYPYSQQQQQQQEQYYTKQNYQYQQRGYNSNMNSYPDQLFQQQQFQQGYPQQYGNLDVQQNGSIWIPTTPVNNAPQKKTSTKTGNVIPNGYSDGTRINAALH